jgi:hypothetical protein
MKTRLTIPLLVIFLITFLARSVVTEVSFEKPALSATTVIDHQKRMIWHYYQAKTNTPWILVQKQKLSAAVPAPYFGGFEMNSTPKNQLRILHAVCPHNKNRCTTFYVAQTHGFTAPRVLLKGNDYEWIKVRDITSCKTPDHGVWAHTRNNNTVLICPMLVKALRNGSKSA